MCGCMSQPAKPQASLLHSTWLTNAWHRSHAFQLPGRSSVGSVCILLIACFGGAGKHPGSTAEQPGFNQHSMLQLADLSLGTLRGLRLLLSITNDQAACLHIHLSHLKSTSQERCSCCLCSGIQHR